MQLIQTVTVGSGGQASIEFGAGGTLPTGFTDLVLVTSLRLSASGPGFAHIRINGLEANYSTRFLQGDGSGASSGSNPGGTTYTWYGTIPGTEATANTFSNAQIYFSNYRSSAAKSWSVDSVMETNGTTSYQSISAHLNGTTSPITSILISAVGPSFAQHSSASLYGITAGSSGGVIVS